MKENRPAVHKIAQSLAERLRRIVTSLSADDPLWREIDAALDGAFCHVQTEIQSLQDSLDRIKDQLNFIKLLQNNFISLTDVQSVALRACDLIQKHTDVDCVTIYLYDERWGLLVPGDMFGTHQAGEFIPHDSQMSKLTIAARCFQERVPIVVQDSLTSEFTSEYEVGTHSFRSALALPLIVARQVLGVLQVECVQQVHLFSQTEIDFFTRVSETVATAIECIRTISEQKIDHKERKELDESYYQIYEDIPIGLFRSTPDGTLVRLNSAMVQILGYPDRETLLRTNLAQLYMDPQKRLKWQAIVETYDIERESEICMRRYDGTEVWVQHSSRTTREPNGNVIYYDSAIVDVSRRKRTEVQIREVVKEKEVLLKEIHHRVKNNLQIVSSLLSLQSDYLRDAYDKELFKQSQNRVKAIALLHEKLYQSADIARIDFEEYLRSLMPNLFQSYKTSLAAIDCVIEANSILLDIDTAIPCGLIVSELVANSLKYAFPDGHAGHIKVTLSHLEQRKFQLSVSDDGVGMDVRASSKAQEATMGWELVRTLTEQLGGTIEVRKQLGTQVVIVFKEKVQKEGMQAQWQIRKS